MKHTFIQGVHLQISVPLAEIYGLRTALLMGYVHDLISEAADGVAMDHVVQPAADALWVAMTHDEWCTRYPLLGVPTSLRNHMDQAIQDGVLVLARHSTGRNRKRSWLRIDYERAERVVKDWRFDRLRQMADELKGAISR